MKRKINRRIKNQHEVDDGRWDKNKPDEIYDDERRGEKNRGGKAIKSLLGVKIRFGVSPEKKRQRQMVVRTGSNA